MQILLVLLLFVTTILAEKQATFKIEGKVSVVDPRFRGVEWMNDTEILVNGGEYKGFLKSDGTFTVSNVAPNSYLVEVASANYLFEPYRVDITKGGKIRARRANFLQPTNVQVVAYPLRFVAAQQAPFFEIREKWKVTDVLYNPMVLMMIVPLLFVFVMPKLMAMADPEAQKEMQGQMGAFSAMQSQQKLPEMSDILSSWFGNDDGKGAKKKRLLNKDLGPTRRAAGKRR